MQYHQHVDKTQGVKSHCMGLFNITITAALFSAGTMLAFYT